MLLETFSEKNPLYLSRKKNYLRNGLRGKPEKEEEGEVLWPKWPLGIPS